ncbi:WD40 repeat domain-containing protein [Larkinella terrae]|uniref:Novel STAND NTPase 1 domain-containing protein n=1 Tax=Larkinella terrae TaxID=2025311 RepID=A0A7K0EJF8_9BACT|nr:WD40 repeat domain-containing protein [Larkinella terrae]MRS62000.1 hypothetical protein [Larkinella terrae]
MTETYTKVAFANPFPGLRSFEPEDSPLFFGRENQIHDLKERLADAHFLAIVGSSGSGKSSLVKAGLVPHLLTHNVASATFNAWQVVSFSPEATPIRNFSQALHQTFGRQNRSFSDRFSAETIEKLLRTEPATILEWSESANFLIVIDQFEDVFRYLSTEDGYEEVALFINLILEMSRKPDESVYVVLTMRSDYLDDCTDYEGLTEAINNGYYLLPKMNREEIRRAIVTPIQVMGAGISDELTTRLLQDIGNKADQLPILQHALMRTWNYWQLNRKIDSLIDLPDYEAIGTMRKAITVHAEEVFGDLPDEKSQLATEKLFKALIVLGEGNTSIIRPIPISTISEVSGVIEYLLIDVLNRFRERDVAFLTPSITVHADPNLIIDISHERLMTLWERLQTWVKEETDSAKFYLQVSNSATLYHEGKTGLWVNPELQIGLKWLAENRPTPAWANRYDPYLERSINFLEYSRNQYEFEVQNKEERQKKELRRARFFAAFLGAGSLISLFFLIVSAVLRTEALQSEETAIAEKKIALFERNRAESQTREAITQKKIAEQQGIIAEQQKRLTEEQRVIAVRGQQTIELKRQEAETARGLAVAQTQRAEEARNDAQRQRQQADGARKDAEQQKSRAEGAQKEAESQRAVAQTAQQFAEQQRGKAVARTLAVQSYQLNENAQDDLQALLALEAYNLNLKNGGLNDNPDIFNALSKAADANTVLRRHSDMVRTVAVQPGSGSQLLATGSDDGTIKLWAANNLNEAPQSLKTPRRSANGVRTVLFSNDGKTVFGGGESGWLYGWSTQRTDAIPTSIKGHSVPILALLPVDDFARLVSVSADGQVRSWKPVANRLDSLQNTHSNFPIYCAQASRDGKRLFCGSNNGQILSFDLADLTKKPEVIKRRQFGNRVTALAFSLDGTQLITGTSTGLLYAWKVANNEFEFVGSLLSGRHTSTVSDIVFSPNGKLVASSSADWTIHIWDYDNLSKQQQPIVINDFDSWVMAIRFTNDSKRLIACGADRTVRIRNIDPAELYAELTRKVKRNLTNEEWNKYIGKDIPYEKTKPD